MTGMTEQEFYAELGKRVKALRKKAKMRQEDVATKTGLQRTVLSAFESRGQQIKSANHIRLIVEATGHTMEDLFVDASEKKLNLKLTSTVSQNALSDEIIDENAREDAEFLDRLKTAASHTNDQPETAPD
jgi:transcriptional regulator with XRE-family HTH domain